MRGSSKLKLLYILDIMKKTDEFHPLNARQIAEKLAARGIWAERKSIARDLMFLNEAGFSILRCEAYNQGYYMTDHPFEDYELKLLSDAVAAAPFLTAEDTRTLQHKIAGLATAEGEAVLRASRFTDETPKSKDSANKRKMDVILRAVKAKQKLAFQYKGKRQEGGEGLTRRGYLYKVSPYYFVLNHGQYYVIGNTDTNTHLSHYRMDRMVNPVVLEVPRRPPSEIPAHGDRFDLAAYLRSAVHMWTGEPVTIALQYTGAGQAGIGETLRARGARMQTDGRGVLARLTVTDSPGLYAWLASLGPNVKVLEPGTVQRKLLAYVRRIAHVYGREEQHHADR